MMFHFVATRTNDWGSWYVSSDKYHKNEECPCLSNVEAVLRITGQQKDGFEPCGQCYERELADD